jgi:hypothetical protein
MGQSQAAAGIDRLPWLPDEPAQKAKRGRGLFAWAAAAILVVAGLSYWLGSRAGGPPAASKEARSVTTVALPPARPLATQPEVKLDRVPEVEPIVAPPMPVVDTPRVVRRPLIKSVAVPEPTDEVKSTAEDEAAAASTADPLALWPVRAIDGASGRLVRVGTFSTAHKAKKGWWAIVRMNPALKRLPALVVPVRSLRNGRTYYRLQMGTTSQAHSAVLCQRMRMIGQSCVVIGVGSAAEADAK